LSQMFGKSFLGDGEEHEIFDSEIATMCQ